MISDEIAIINKYGGLLLRQNSKLDLSKGLGAYHRWYCRIRNPRLISYIGVLAILASNNGHELIIQETTAYSRVDWMRLCSYLVKYSEKSYES